MAKRNLTSEEIAVLEDHGCAAEDWNRVTVSEDFTPGHSFRRVFFSGTVELGVYRGSIRTPDGFTLPCGVYYSSLYDVSLGDNCLVNLSQIACADLGDNVLLDSVGSLSRRGDSPFANASPAHVLAEDGARSVLLWRNLSSQLAHILCHFKNHPAALALEEIIRCDAQTLRLPRSVISSGCRVRRVGLMRNVWMGEGASVLGAAFLEDCYIASSRNAPTRIGEGVAARDCVFLTGSDTFGGVRLSHCLVGEGVRLEDGFTAKHSLLFANSTFSQGEASCAMAGPYAVSTHKATLVLTCECSFSTFGSAANSSNHHFKLGPLHGGVMRRGVRCGSGSYIFWPSDIGAFTTVVGRHQGHLDTADFPFSLLIAKGDMSILVPGVSLFTSGSFRDARKWRERDRRGGLDHPRDLVNSAILSPYALQAVEAGMELLRRSADMGVDLRHGGAVIPASRLEPALHLYETALVFHLGERLLSRAGGDGAFPAIADLIRVFQAAAVEPRSQAGSKWRDWGGMLIPGMEAEKFLADLEEERLAEPAEVRARLEDLHARYDEFEWNWLAWRWRSEYGEATPETLGAFLEKWRRAILFRHECLVKDANKEFTPDAMFGFGVEEDRAVAFRRVRGTLAEHPLLALAEAERDHLLALAEKALAAMKAVPPEEGSLELRKG